LYLGREVLTVLGLIVYIPSFVFDPFYESNAVSIYYHNHDYSSFASNRIMATMTTMPNPQEIYNDIIIQATGSNRISIPAPIRMKMIDQIIKLLETKNKKIIENGIHSLITYANSITNTMNRAKDADELYRATKYDNDDIAETKPQIPSRISDLHEF
jgi:hypothetical protein